MDDDLLALARRPPISIHPDATVRSAAALMVEHNVGAAVVLNQDGSLAGILSERDIVARVVARHHDPDKMLVSEIMTKNVKTARPSDTSSSALEAMASGNFRHLPIVDASGKVVGMLSVRHLMRAEMGALSRRNAELVNFIGADGAGG